MHIQESIAKEMEAGRPTAACRTLMAFTKLKLQHKISSTTAVSGLEQVSHHATGKQPQRLVGSGCGECQHNADMDGCEGTVGFSTIGTTQTKTGTCWTVQTSATVVDGSCSTKVGSGGSTVCDADCSSIKNTTGGGFICDIEDITAMMPQCLFNRPAQYYLKVVNAVRPSS